MKKFLKNWVFGFLTLLVRVRLKRLHPFIIGVTGSVGKTSTKDALYTILKTRYRIVRNEKSYNTEFGLPLAILEQPSGFSSAWEWLKILVRSTWKAFIGGHELQLMVLEMGVDKPGDMDVLLRMVRPQIGIITALKPVHIEEGKFRDLDDIFLEKSKLVKALPEKGIAILNADDPYLSPLNHMLSCRKIFYGFAEWAQLRVLELETKANGIRFTLSYGQQLATEELALPGKFQIYVVLPAIAAALTQGFTLVEACEALRSYQLPPGRMNLLEGIHETTIIDSSYNASPESMKEALEVLKECGDSVVAGVIKPRRKIAVLGSMNELGRFAEKFHREVGKAASGKTDILITIGDEARWIAEEAQNNGFPKEATAHFAHAEEAIEYLRPLLQKGDMILVKGSQNKIRLEKLVRAFLKDPSLAEEVLVRQDKQWQHIL